MRHCKVSICIPAYNEPDFLESALRSCLAQTFADFEIVICDDSSDLSVERVVKEYAQIDNRIRYLRNQKPLGAAGNSNRTAEYAAGEWIKFLYQDDEFLDEGSLQYLIDCASGCDFLVSPSICQKGGRTRIHSLKPSQLTRFSRDPVAALLRYGNILGAPSATMVKKSHLIPFKESMTWMFDYAMYLEAAARHTDFRLLPKPVVIINQHERQLTHKVSGSDEIELTESLIIFNKIGHMPEHSRAAFFFLVHKLVINGSRLPFQRYNSILHDAGFRSVLSWPLWLAGRLMHALANAWRR